MMQAAQTQSELLPVIAVLYVLGTFLQAWILFVLRDLRHRVVRMENLHLREPGPRSVTDPTPFS